MHPWQPESDPEAFPSDEDWELEKIVSEDYDALGRRRYDYVFSERQRIYIFIMSLAMK